MKWLFDLFGKKEPPGRPTDDWFDHQGESVAQIVALEGRYKTASLVNAVYCLNLKSPRAKGQPVAYLHAVWTVDGAVKDGGFFSYGYNIGGVDMDLLYDALEAMGLDARAAIVRQALALTGLRHGMTNDEADTHQQDLSDEASEEVDALDTAYFEVDDNFDERVWGYIKANVAAFR